MKMPLPKPVQRSALRLFLGKLYYVNKRRLQWYLTSTRYAQMRSKERLPHLHAQHATPMLRELPVWICNCNATRCKACALPPLALMA